MRLTIELAPNQEQQLFAAAKGQGIDLEAFIQKLIADYLAHAVSPGPDAENQALIDLLRSWREEDATDDEQELERRDAETKEFLSNLEASRLTLRVPEV